MQIHETVKNMEKCQRKKKHQKPQKKTTLSHEQRL
jgi:hypothetical protein